MAGPVDFEHEPLDLDRPTFRLLQLLRGDGSTIDCMLYQAYLDGTDTVPYDALSYNWGSADMTAAVTVNSQQLNVTTNLHSALRHLRSKDMDKVLWIDAICVDQKNDAERGHQVQQMCEIYSKADEVLVWLGEATSETNLLMESLHRLEEHVLMHEHRTWNREQLQSIWSLGTHNQSPELSKGLELLLDRPWFRRVWILQEIASAKKASIWCGARSTKALIFAFAPSLMGVQPKRHCQAVLDIIPGRLREQSWWNDNRDLYNLLLKFRDSEAGDQRDNVYALLGISSNAQNAPGLMPDYSKSLQDVISDTSSFLFGPSDIVYETMSDFLHDLPSRYARNFLDAVGESDVNEVEYDSAQQDLGEPQSRDTISTITRYEDNPNSTAMLVPPRTEIKVTEGMIWAVAGNMNAVVQLLRQCKTSLDYEEVMKVLRTASANGNQTMVKLLLANSAIFDGLDLNGKTQDECYKYVLYLASANGHMNIVKLLNEGVNGTGDHESPQSRALRHAVYDEARYDLALALASANGHAEIIELLLEMGANVNMQRNYSHGMRRDLGASKYTAVKLLADKGTETNSYCMVYVNPLHLASANGHEQVVKLLLRKGADVNARSFMHVLARNTTALQAASAGGHEHVVKLLLERGAMHGD